MSLLSIGTRGLAAAQGELSTASHNIANVNTPGYSRQETVLATATPQYSGGGYFGRGVDIATVRRQYDQFLGSAVQTSGSRAAADAARSDGLSQLDKLFANPDQGIGAAMDDVFGAANDLASRASDSAARQVFLNRNQQFAQRVTTVGQALDQLGRTTNAQISQTVSQVNNQVAEIGRINGQIAQMKSTGQEPNDLLDRRDQMLQDLNQLISVNAVTGNDGSFNLFAANGTPLLVGARASELVAVPGTSDPNQWTVSLKQGPSLQSLDGMDLGGRIGGLMQFRDGDLRAVMNQVGKIAVTMADKVNTQQSLGVDAAGNSGQAVFSIPTPRAIPASTNTGAARITASFADTGALTASDYKVDYDGSAYTITRLADGLITTAPIFPATVDGLRFDAVGAAAAGDSFVVQPFSLAATSIATRPLMPKDVAAAQAATVQTTATNQGSAVVKKFDVVRSTTDTVLPVTVTFNDPPNSFNVVGLASGDLANVPYTPGQPVPAAPADYNGWRLTLEGTAVAGDTFTVKPTANPATNNGNALAFARLSDQRSADGSTLAESYAQTLGDVGIRVQSARDASTVSNNLLSEAQSRQQAVSGVNLDEEAANLLRYQQAYQASAKIIQTSQQVFDTLLAAVGN